ncbi:MAG: hypothetical protein NW216_13880 [Hyphomicrobium sp.]|nr:hypothetical protein [Hyphomicrobium sp.]
MPVSRAAHDPRGTRYCFVISPIGEANSPEREHANLVRDLIIRPAVEGSGGAPGVLCPQFKARRDRREGETGPRYFVHRGDDDLTSRIMDRVAHNIVAYDLIVAILTSFNPNVLYELGIAHSAGRKVVLLRSARETTKLPFDIQHERYIPYTLEPDERPRLLDVVRTAMQKAVDEEYAAAENAASDRPIAAFNLPKLEPLGLHYRNNLYQDKLPETSIHLRHAEAASGAEPFVLNEVQTIDQFRTISFPEIADFIGSSRQHLTFVEPNHELFNGALQAALDGRENKIGDALKQVLQRMKVTVLVTDPLHSNLLDVLPQIGGATEKAQAMHREGVDLWTHVQKQLAPDCLDLKLVQTRVLTNRAIINERGAIALPRFYGTEFSNWQPCFKLSAHSNYYKSLAREADLVAKDEAARIRGLDHMKHRSLTINKRIVLDVLNDAKEFIYWLNPAVNPYEISESHTPFADIIQSLLLGVSMRRRTKDDTPLNVRILLAQAGSDYAVISQHLAEETARAAQTPEPFDFNADAILEQARRSWVACEMISQSDPRSAAAGALRVLVTDRSARSESVLITDTCCLMLPMNAFLTNENEIRGLRLDPGSVSYDAVRFEIEMLLGESSWPTRLRDWPGLKPRRDV